MKNLKIRSKITLGFAVVIVLMLISTATVTVTNITNIEKLKAIDADSGYQILGTHLSNTFYEARMNTKILFLQINDDVYMNSVKYTEECYEIINDMEACIDEHPILDKFSVGLNEIHNKIKEYGREVDALQNSNTALGIKEDDMRAMEKILTELSDALLSLNISALNRDYSDDTITAAERQRHMEEMTNGALISDGIWNIRDHKNSMSQEGPDYTDYENDLQYIDKIIEVLHTANFSSGSDEIEKLKTYLTEYREYIVQFREEMDHNNIIINNIVSVGVDVLESIASMTEDVDSKMEKQINESITNATTSFIAVISIAVVSIIISVIIAAYIIRSIISVLGKSVKNMEEISNIVATSSQQLNEGSQQLAEGTSEQAASIEETSATMNQTNSMVRQTKENTYQAAGLSKQSDLSASESVQKVEYLLEIMGKLNVSSKEIGKIVDTIDSIAFQTNILSLNASVEAVRAGEAGKSFSVVAEEVRSLSLRSKEAVSSTAEIIEKNLSLIEQCYNSANEVSDSLTGISADVQKVSTFLSEISEASEEQIRGIDQITVAISQMEKATQSSAAVAQQTSASANEMLNSSELLTEVTAELSAII